MARMSIDDAVTRAPEFDYLAELVGWHRRETAMTVIEIWAICYDRITPNLQPRDIETTARRGARIPPSTDFVPAMIECGLARYATKFDTAFITPKGERIQWRDQEWRGRVTIRGAAERIAYLIKNKQSGAVGGKRSGESRRDGAKRPFDENQSGASQGAQASANPSASVPDSASASASDKPTPRVTQKKNAPAEPSPPGYTESVSLFFLRFEAAYQAKPSWGQKQGAQLKQLLKSHPAAEVQRRIAILFDSPPNWLKPPFDFGTLVQHFDKLVVASVPRGASSGRIEPSKPGDYPEGDQAL